LPNAFPVPGTEDDDEDDDEDEDPPSLKSSYGEAGEGDSEYRERRVCAW
jgi:hypothetical protein